MQNKQLPLSLLCILGIGAMVGLGVFNLPSELAAEANAGPIILSWIINISGLSTIVYVFKILSNKKRGDIGGMYAYAKNYSGEFGGSLVAFGYYLCTLFAVAFFFQRGMQSLEIIIPSIGANPSNGLNLTKLALSSIMLWYICACMLKGILEVSNVSLITTAFKILPLILIIIAGLISFDISNIKGVVIDETRALEIGSLETQLKATTSSILWLFVGFEGLSIISGRAYKNSDVGTAIVWSFCVTAVLYFLISVVCLGALPIQDLAKLPPASTGFVLQRLVGRWGQLFIDFSMLISVFGAILVWSTFGVEMLYLASKDKLFIDKLGVEKDGIPRNAVIFTIVILQLMLIASYLFDVNYKMLDSIMTTTLLIPYIITILYCFKYVLDEENYAKKSKKIIDLLITIASLIYIGWAMYSTGVMLLTVALGIYSFGVLIYIFNKLLRKQKVFNKKSLICSLIILCAGFITVYILIKDLL